ncbi:MAG: FAD-dependent thymidylate synthase [Minisyncoccia bacterium]
MRKIIVSHELPPEANAMALAMYSRDPQSFDVHLETVNRVGPEKFLSQYYVGYGHKSIGDCGSTTICAENVSMLCAKAIQQWALYNGQEASTRYIDMRKQEILNPLKTKAGKEIQDGWMKIYNKMLEVLPPYLKEKFPIREDENPKVYERAINAKAFDIARSLLPAGATTYVGWHTNLRQAVDHLAELRNHPLDEIKETAEEIAGELHKKYPSSGFDKRYEETESFIRSYMDEYIYLEPETKLKKNQQKNFSSTNAFNTKAIKKYKDLLAKRPQKTELPFFLKKFGTITYQFLLDFGSFRDLQRHRSGIILMPPLTTRYGFNKWYLEQIPKKFQKEVLDVIKKQTKKIHSLKCDEKIKQYYTAMGFNVMCGCTFDLPAGTYLAELRSGQTVHPTLRIVAQEMGKTLQKLFPYMRLYCDYSPDLWSSKRGTQTITKKSEN